MRNDFVNSIRENIAIGFEAKLSHWSAREEMCGDKKQFCRVGQYIGSMNVLARLSDVGMAVVYWMKRRAD